ncbi:MAG: hypothetical protein BM556_12065 [Bacteriovorax sp. MedPE-SWde]|nr:MAG: hypothetical protein BM556_12065 [Bacteriovorax sp. MedPE-SWde]
MMKLKYLTISLLICFNTTSFAKKVIIDPGHGGQDCGAKAKIWKKKKLKVLCEKDLTLKIALLLKKFIDQSKRHSAFLTRITDKSLSLDKRSKMADHIKADVFISVHLNATTNKNASGFETYYLDNHDDVAIQKVEKVENKDISGEQKVINSILADLVVERVAPQSKILGNDVHNAIKYKLTKRYKLKDRGLKPGLFYVLALSKRPSILLEAGFLTNKAEAGLMNDHWFQRVYAKNVAKGIIKYLDRNSNPNLF